MDSCAKQKMQFFYNRFMEVHPLYPERTKEFEAYYNGLLGKEISIERALTDFTVMVGDGHTNIEVPYNEDSLCVNVCGHWIESGLQIDESTATFLQPGDIVVGVGNETIDTYFHFLEHQIPHENKYLVQSRSCQYPYENYNAFSFRNYSEFASTEEKVMKLRVLRRGQIIDLAEPFVKYDMTLRFIDELEENRFSFQEDNVGKLVLVTCSYDEQTKQLLHDFFYEVKQRQTKQIILELSKNMGGNSNVINEFLRYIDIDYFRHYEIYEREGMVLKCIQSCEKLCENQAYEWSRYQGEIICNIGNDTFSSARMFAVILKDNDIAKLTGSPSGGKPSACGQPVRGTIQTEDGKQLKYRISTRLFLRPNRALENQEALFPDIRDVPFVTRSVPLS